MSGYGCELTNGLRIDTECVSTKQRRRQTPAFDGILLGAGSLRRGGLRSTLGFPPWRTHRPHSSGAQCRTSQLDRGRFVRKVGNSFGTPIARQAGPRSRAPKRVARFDNQSFRREDSRVLWRLSTRGIAQARSRRTRLFYNAPAVTGRLVLGSSARATETNAQLAEYVFGLPIISGRWFTANWVPHVYEIPAASDVADIVTV